MKRSCSCCQSFLCRLFLQSACACGAHSSGEQLVFSLQACHFPSLYHGCFPFATLGSPPRALYLEFTTLGSTLKSPPWVLHLELTTLGSLLWSHHPGFSTLGSLPWTHHLGFSTLNSPPWALYLELYCKLTQLGDSTSNSRLHCINWDLPSILYFRLTVRDSAPDLLPWTLYHRHPTLDSLPQTPYLGLSTTDTLLWTYRLVFCLGISKHSHL